MSKYSRSACSIVAAFLTLQTVVPAGDLFFQSRNARSKHCIPAFDYRTSRAEATTAVTSAAAVPLLDTQPANNRVVENSRQFVLPDAQSGPILLSDLSAKTFPDRGMLLVTGILTHSGGVTGQQQGAKAVIRVDALGGVGNQPANLPVIARREAACWVRQNEPETVQIMLECNPVLLAEIQRVGRIRLFLEYHPNR